MSEKCVHGNRHSCACQRVNHASPHATTHNGSIMQDGNYCHHCSNAVRLPAQSNMVFMMPRRSRRLHSIHDARVRSPGGLATCCAVVVVTLSPCNTPPRVHRCHAVRCSPRRAESRALRAPLKAEMRTTLLPRTNVSRYFAMFPYLPWRMAAWQASQAVSRSSSNRPWRSAEGGSHVHQHGDNDEMTCRARRRCSR